jgi:hypothetical protein
MRAPGRQRLAEIADEMVEVVNPPANQRAACRANVDRYIKSIGDYTKAPRGPSAGEFKQKLKDYLKALHATKRNNVRLPKSHSYFDEHQQFLAQLDAEIQRMKVEQANVEVPRGHKPVDPIAIAAVQYAIKLLDPDWYRRPRQELPPLTKGKRWHLLSQLLYEAASGEADRDHVLDYMRRSKKFRRVRLLLPYYD